LSKTALETDDTAKPVEEMGHLACFS